MDRYLVTFDLRGITAPEDIYKRIYDDISDQFGDEHYSKEMMQFCIVRSDFPADAVCQMVKRSIMKQSNRFKTFELCVTKLADRSEHDRAADMFSCSSSGIKSIKLKRLRRFLVGDVPEDEREYGI